MDSESAISEGSSHGEFGEVGVGGLDQGHVQLHIPGSPRRIGVAFAIAHRKMLETPRPTCSMPSHQDCASLGVSRNSVEAAVSLLFLKLRLHTPCRVASETQKHDLTAIPLHHTAKKPGRGFMERSEMSRAMGTLTAGQKVQRFSTMQTPARRSLRCACHFLKRLHAACFTALDLPCMLVALDVFLLRAWV